MRSPRSAEASLLRPLIRPFCEGNRAGRMYHSLIDLNSDCGVSDCADWQCSPKAGLKRPITWEISLAWAVTSPGCTLTTVMERCWRYSRGTSSSGPVVSNTVWFQRLQRPSRRPSSPSSGPPPGFAKEHVGKGRPELPLLKLPVFHGGP